MRSRRHWDVSSRRPSNGKRLAQYTVPGTKAPLPVGGVEGYTHCGFTPEQMTATWNALKGWVETGTRPATDAVR